MENIHFRQAVPEDARRILEIYQYSIQHEDATYLTECPSWEDWDNEYDREKRIVAEIDGEVIGFAAVQVQVIFRKEIEVGTISIYVDCRYRRTGIGSMLLRCLVAFSQYKNKQKIEYLLLHSKIFTNNTASIQLHEKVGFERIALCKKSLKKNGKLRDVYVYERRIRMV